LCSSDFGALAKTSLLYRCRENLNNRPGRVKIQLLVSNVGKSLANIRLAVTGKAKKWEQFGSNSEVRMTNEGRNPHFNWLALSCERGFQYYQGVNPMSGQDSPFGLRPSALGDWNSG
jgi:hypothetical protein